jgi:hypothetical protein
MRIRKGVTADGRQMRYVLFKPDSPEPDLNKVPRIEVVLELRKDGKHSSFWLKSATRVDTRKSVDLSTEQEDAIWNSLLEDLADEATSPLWED